MLNSYRSELNDVLNNNSNLGLSDKSLNLNLKENIKYTIENLENNMKLLSENYFKNYYSNNYTSFLEYPEEIKYKIHNFNNVIKILIDSMKKEINKLYKDKIIFIIKSTNYFISNMIDSHKKYILIYLNKNDVIHEYLDSKINLIINNFNEFSSLINNFSTDIIKNSNLKIDDLILTINNYDLPITSILDNIKLFQNQFIHTINNDFDSENCYDNFEYLTTDFSKEIESYILPLNNSNESKFESKNIFCSIILNKHSFQNYEYNYNIVKLRTGLNYTKNAIENIMNLNDEFKYDEMLNIIKFNDNENILNDNNILFIENNTLSKLNEINDNSYILLGDEYEKIKEDISKKYNLNNDYYSYLKEFEKLLKLEKDKIKNNINNYINDVINSINSLFNEFNNILYEQKNKYDFYNIKDIKIFEKNLMKTYDLIQSKFNSKYNDLINLKNTVKFQNILANHLSDLQKNKREYFKAKINELGKNYNLYTLNLTVNIGEYFEKFIEKKYEDLELNYIFDYIKIYESNAQSYINNLIIYFNDYKIRILNKFKSLINDFLKKFKEGASNFVNNEYILEIKRNYTDCFGLSMDLLNQTIEEDKLNYEKYISYLKKKESIESNCPSDNFSDISDNCILSETEMEEITYFNKTKHLYFCHENRYFNYTVTIFENFEDNYQYKLNDLSNKILIAIEKNNLDINFLNTYLKNEINLNFYSLTEDDLLGDFAGFEDMIVFLNYSYNSNYQDYLKKSLLDSFEISYNNYINNYLIEYLKGNINIYINSKFNFYNQYLIEKISDEFNYYILLFNETNEIGNGTFNAFTNLYQKTLLKNIKFYYDIIEEDALFYINLFYRKNKYIFKENFIQFFVDELNDYNIHIYGLKEFNFNKSLNDISEKLFNNIIIKELNNTFKISYNNKISQLISIINNYNIKMMEILVNINKNEDNLNINQIIMSYQEILISQKNKFNFQFGNAPFDLLYDFIKNILEPPLIKIKVQYNEIEKKILDRISNSINNFPDYSSILKAMLGDEELFNYINSLYYIIKNILLEYGDDIDIDINNYINKLIHYTYIKGLYTYDEPCIYSFCKIDIKYNKTNSNLEKRNLKNKYKRKLSQSKNRKYDNLKINKNIYLNGFNYNEEMGALTKDDIIYVLINTKKIIEQLNLTFQTNFDSKIKLKLAKYLSKINGTYLFKLKKSISNAALKFSTYLSKDSFKILESKMFYHYDKLEKYVHNFSNYLNKSNFDLIDTIKNSSNYLQNIIDFTYDKILIIHDTFIKIIENRYSSITFDEYNNYKKYANKRFFRNIEMEFDLYIMERFEETFSNIKEQYENLINIILDIGVEKKMNIFNEITIKFDTSDDNGYDIDYNEDEDFDFGIEASLVLKNFEFESFGIEAKIEKCKDIFKWEYPINISILIPELQFRIIPVIELGACCSIGLEFEVNKDEIETNIVEDFSLSALAAVKLEIGLYFPAESSGFQMSFAIGIKGILGSGKVGLKASISLLNQNESKIVLYYEYQAIQMYFYILFKIEIELEFFQFTFEFYILDMKILSACKKCEGEGEIPQTK